MRGARKRKYGVIAWLLLTPIAGCGRPIAVDTETQVPLYERYWTAFRKAEHGARSCDSLPKTADFLRGAANADDEFIEAYASFIEGMAFVDPECLLSALDLLSDKELAGTARYLRAPMFHPPRLFVDLLAQPEIEDRYERIRRIVPLKRK